MHQIQTDSKDFKTYDFRGSKKFKQSTIEFLRQNKYITKQSSYLCTTCSNSAEQVKTTVDSKQREDIDYGPEINVQRIGDRNNDAKMSNAERYNFFDLIFAFKRPAHPKSSMIIQNSI